jgi:hypothetical protein
MEPTNQGEVGKEVAKLSQVIQIDEGKIQEYLGERQDMFQAFRTR